ncbi:hypothetical protein LY76DRAFT_337512 [Colletotrichum caudatum]|nr:hypothetical protein LY76DRAFT_337512 [Colletotrichum caudatum]
MFPPSLPLSFFLFISSPRCLWRGLWGGLRFSCFLVEFLPSQHFVFPSQPASQPRQAVNSKSNGLPTLPYLGLAGSVGSVVLIR